MQDAHASPDAVQARDRGVARDIAHRRGAREATRAHVGGTEPRHRRQTGAPTATPAAPAPCHVETAPASASTSSQHHAHQYAGRYTGATNRLERRRKQRDNEEAGARNAIGRTGRRPGQGGRKQRTYNQIRHGDQISSIGTAIRATNAQPTPEMAPVLSMRPARANRATATAQ